MPAVSIISSFFWLNTLGFVTGLFNAEGGKIQEIEITASISQRAVIELFAAPLLQAC
jgi:hypothetical protein